MMERSLSPAWADSGAPTRRNSAETTRFYAQVSDVDAAERGHLNHLQAAPSDDATYANSTTPALEKQQTDVDHNVSSNEHIDIYDPNRPKLSIKERLRHFTFAWYTMPMSTGGLSLLIYAQPNQFTGLKTIGLVVYILNIIAFSFTTLTMLARFFLHTGSFSKAVTHPREGLFLPTFFLSIATIITSTERYAIPEGHVPLKWAIQAAFWIYVAFTAVLAIGQYSYIFAAHNYGLQTMMPTWILPIFPIMLSGTIASVIADTQPDVAAMPIIIAGITCQGLGMSVAMLMYAHMIGRLMQSGLPNREHRPGLFMCVGPPAFTALALIGMGNSVPEGSEDMFVAKNIVRLIAILAAVFLWALSLWWFGIAVIAVISSPPKYFHLGWWAMVFPNTGFTLATISIAKELASKSIKWVTTGMSIFMVILFLFVLVNHVRAVLVQDIMYPGRDEDVEDH